ncbi:MAG: hypothetical protein ACRD4E_00615 [Bryobacteraceae bacterium]
MDISRRQLAGVILAGTVAAQSAAQAPPPAAQPTDAEIEAARAERRAAAQIIARVPLPMTTEPAFHFKA